MKKTIILDQELLNKLGTASLEGICWEPQITELVLRVPQTSTQWRIQNGGPDAWICWEYNILCLLESIQHITEAGVKITVEHFIREEEK